MYQANSELRQEGAIPTRSQLESVNLSEFIAAGEKTTRMTSGQPADPSKYWTIRALVDPSYSENTKRSYRIDWESFFEWCSERNIQSLPAAPLAVAAHLAWMANAENDEGEMKFAPASISRRLSAINSIHVAEGLLRPGAHPHVMAAMKGIERLKARSKPHKLPLLLSDISTVVQAIDQKSWPQSVGGQRDIALLLIGMLSGFRLSQLVQMRVGDVEWDPLVGITISIPKFESVAQDSICKVLSRSETGTSTCAPCAFARWVRLLAAAKTDVLKVRRVVSKNRPLEHVCGAKLPELKKLEPSAPLFRTLQSNGRIRDAQPSVEVVRAVVCRRVEAVGMDPTKFAARSLRKGFFQQAIREGAPIEDVMINVNHMGYIRTSQVFNHAMLGRTE